MKLTIDRQNWCRGEENSALLRDDGKMCCLGFLALQCGYTKEQIRHRGTPFNASRQFGEDQKTHTVNKFPSSILDGGQNDQYPLTTLVSSELMGTNDRLGMDEQEREAKITELFKQAGIEVEFTN